MFHVNTNLRTTYSTKLQKKQSFLKIIKYIQDKTNLKANKVVFMGHKKWRLP